APRSARRRRGRAGPRQRTGEFSWHFSFLGVGELDGVKRGDVPLRREPPLPRLFPQVVQLGVQRFQLAAAAGVADVRVGGEHLHEVTQEAQTLFHVRRRRADEPGGFGFRLARGRRGGRGRRRRRRRRTPADD